MLARLFQRLLGRFALMQVQFDRLRHGIEGAAQREQLLRAETVIQGAAGHRPDTGGIVARRQRAGGRGQATQRAQHLVLHHPRGQQHQCNAGQQAG